MIVDSKTANIVWFCCCFQLSPELQYIFVCLWILWASSCTIDSSLRIIGVLGGGESVGKCQWWRNGGSGVAIEEWWWRWMEGGWRWRMDEENQRLYEWMLKSGLQIIFRKMARSPFMLDYSIWSLVRRCELLNVCISVNLPTFKSEVEDSVSKPCCERAESLFRALWVSQNWVQQNLSLLEHLTKAVSLVFFSPFFPVSTSYGNTPQLKQPSTSLSPRRVCVGRRNWPVWVQNWRPVLTPVAISWWNSPFFLLSARCHYFLTTKSLSILARILNPFAKHALRARSSNPPTYTWWPGKTRY